MPGIFCFSRDRKLWGVSFVNIFPISLLDCICYSNGYNEQEYCKLEHACDQFQYFQFQYCDYPPYFKHFHKECYSRPYNSYYNPREIKNSNMFHCLKNYLASISNCFDLFDFAFRQLCQLQWRWMVDRADHGFSKLGQLSINKQNKDNFFHS